MLSVIVPVHNEADNITPLLAEITAVKDRAPIMEIIYVDDGSTDATADALARARDANPLLRVVTLSPRSGQSCAIWEGVRAATQPVIVTLDGDGQNDPADIATLFTAFMDATRAAPRVMAAGQRAARHDDALRVLSSRVANAVRGAFLKDGVRDTGCALKMFRREDYLRLPYFNHMHRFLPALMQREGVRVALIPVGHRPRMRGRSKYGVLNRLFVGVIDLCGVRWLMARARPQGLIVREDGTLPGKERGA